MVGAICLGIAEATSSNNNLVYLFLLAVEHTIQIARKVLAAE